MGGVAGSAYVTRIKLNVDHLSSHHDTFYTRKFDLCSLLGSAGYFHMSVS